MIQTPESERAYWDTHTQREEQFGGDWDDDACLNEVMTGIRSALPDHGAESPFGRIHELGHGPPPWARVLDLGCGTGRLLLPLARAWPGVDWWGIDSSAAMHWTACDEWVAHDRWTVNAVYLQNDGRTLPETWAAVAGDGPPTPLVFDAAYSVLLFQHLPPDAVRGYLGEVARVLKPGGRFRFQYVMDDTIPGNPTPPWQTEGFLNYHYSAEPDMIPWCEEAGMTFLELNPGRVFPQWSWITAVKP